MKTNDTQPEMTIKDMTPRWRLGGRGQGIAVALAAAAIVLAIGAFIVGSASSSAWSNEPGHTSAPQRSPLLTPEEMVEMHEQIRFRAQLRVTMGKLNEMQHRAEQLGTDVSGLDILLDQMQELSDSMDPKRRSK